MYAYNDDGICICARCGCVLTSNNDSRDHFIPKSFYSNRNIDSRQRLTDSENIVHLCKTCNNGIGNTAKGPDWYKHLSDIDKDALYETIHKFILHPEKSDSGIKEIQRYVKAYGSYNLRKSQIEGECCTEPNGVENNIKQEQVSYVENKINNITKDLSLHTILESMVKIIGIGSSIKVGEYMLNITDNGLELDLAY